MHLSLNNSLGKWILPKEPAPFSPEATNYFSRLDAAGDTTYVDYKQPLANYIDSLVALGGAYWDTMLSSTSFVGVGIQGVTVPLRDGMTVPTNNNFVAADLDQLTGLKGDKASKYLDTGTIGSDYGQNDCSMSAYITSPAGITTYVMGAGGTSSGSFLMLAISSSLEARSMSSIRRVLGGPIASLTGFVGTSRTASTGYDERANSTSTSELVTSSTPITSAMSVFASSAALPTDARLATYHAGPALDLATLEGLQATLLSEIRTAHTFVAAASYFSRLAAAGDTTHVAYKQPLTNYITSLVELGGAYWDTMESAASFVGVGIQGITVPLRDGMTSVTNVNNNFVAADLDQLTGLKGDGATKYISTGVNNNDNAQNDLSVSVYVSDPQTTGLSVELGTGNVFSRLTLGRRDNAGPELFHSNQSGAVFVPVATEPSGFYGHSRSDGSGYAVYYNGATTNTLAASQAPQADPITVFSAVGAFPSSARLATYHIGPALDLATLEGLQATLLAEIASIGFSTEAASYFSRLVSAGDTTFLAYRQPLANYIDSLVTLGGAYWDDMKSSASFVGVGIKGITVPLRSGMTVPTQNNFVDADLNQLTGLKGDGSLKRIDALPNMSGFSQDDVSMSVYQTELLTDQWLAGSTNLYIRRASFSTTCFAAAQTGAFPTLGLSGTSRSSSAGYTYRTNNIDGAKTATSAAISDSVFSVLGWRGQSFSNGRVATYHVGPALDLATLEGLQETLITEIAAI